VPDYPADAAQAVEAAAEQVRQERGLAETADRTVAWERGGGVWRES
jgi:hypothetical protein